MFNLSDAERIHIRKTKMISKESANIGLWTNEELLEAIEQAEKGLQNYQNNSIHFECFESNIKSYNAELKKRRLLRKFFEVE